MAVIQMTDDRFEEVVLKSELPVMVDFGATWCGPCKKVEPIIEELSEEYEGKVIAVKCDVEECPGTAAKFGGSPGRSEAHWRHAERNRPGPER